MTSLAGFRVCIPFRQAFRHGSADRRRTQAIWVEVERDGTVGVGEGCPREYVTGESLETAERFVARHARSWERDIATLDDLTRWVVENEEGVDRDPAAWCAVELAFLDLFGRERAESVEQILSLRPLKGSFRYTAVVGDSDADIFAGTVGRYRLMGFSHFKVKLSGDPDRDRHKLAVLAASGVSDSHVRVDANNLWENADEAVRHLSALGFAFFGIEEPIAANRLDALREVSRRMGCRIILDESLLRARQLELLAPDPELWILNVRVSKMGGLLRSLNVLRRARELGLPIIVGAQVGETSLLTRAGLSVASEAGDALVGQEGAFGTHLLERDVCEASIMFGDGGVVDCDAWGLERRSGFGIDVSADRSPFQAIAIAGNGHGV